MDGKRMLAIRLVAVLSLVSACSSTPGAVPSSSTPVSSSFPLLLFGSGGAAQA